MNDKEKVAQWMIKQGFATGHGDSIEDLLKELDEQIGRRIVRQRNNFGKVLVKAVSDEREACAKKWVGLNDDEREHFRKLGFVGVLAVENKLKEKNGG